jgi:purine-binding chemotaxis protein CheW
MDAQADLMVVVCQLHQELYALELGSAIGVLAARGLTGVPSVPPHIAGVLNVRGDIITVLDLGAILGLGASAAAQTDRVRVVLVETPRARVGLLVDAVTDIRHLSLDRLERPLSDRLFVRGIVDAQIVLLDLERLLAEQHLEVNEQLI